MRDGDASHEGVLERARTRFEALPDWVTGSLTALGIWAASRLVMWGAAYMVHVMNPLLDTFSLFMGWDAGWYLSVAENGYPRSVPPGTGPDAQTSLVFFPGYPLMFKAISGAFNISLRQAAEIVTLFSGAVASVLLWHLARHFTDREAAARAVALLVFFPAAYVLSMAYAEATFLMFVAGCLLALVHRRWTIAGLCAAAAGATRLHGIALAFVCAWAAFVAIRDRREWKSLLAPLLAPMGTLAFLGFQWFHTGSPFTWLDSQRRGWNNEASSTVFFEQVGRLFSQDRFHDFTVWQGGIGLIFIVIGVLLFVMWRPPSLLVVYTVAVMVPTMLGGLLSPRYYLVVLPLFIAIARIVKGGTFYALLGASATMMAMLWTVVSLTNVTVP